MYGTFFENYIFFYENSGKKYYDMSQMYSNNIKHKVFMNEMILNKAKSRDTYRKYLQHRINE